MKLDTCPIYFINLERRPDRYNVTVPLLKKHGFNNITHLKAIDASKVNVLKYVHKDHIKPILDNQRTKHSQLSKGAVGCTLSHLIIYKDILKKRIQHAIVFEDDVLPTRHISKIQVSLDELPNDWDIILLGGIYDKNRLYNRYLCHVGRFYQTHAYIINNKKLEYLLQHGIPITYQIDSWLSDLLESGKIKIYGMIDDLKINPQIATTDIQTRMVQE